MDFHPNTIDYGFWPIDYAWAYFHPNTIDFGLWTNLHPNTIDYGF